MSDREMAIACAAGVLIAMASVGIAAISERMAYTLGWRPYGRACPLCGHVIEEDAADRSPLPQVTHHVHPEAGADQED